MERQRNSAVSGVCNAACLELGKDPVPWKTVTNFLKSIDSKLITCKNSSPPINQAFIFQSQVNYVEDVFFTRDTANLGISRMEAIQTISDIVQACSCVQSENHLYCLIREKRLPNLKRHGRVIKYQATNMEWSHIYVSQQYRWYMMIEADWEDLRQKNSPCDIFPRFSHYLQFNLDETSFLCNEGDIKVIGIKDKPRLLRRRFLRWCLYH